MAANLEIQVGADIRAAVTALNRFEKEVAETGKVSQATARVVQNSFTKIEQSTKALQTSSIRTGDAIAKSGVAVQKSTRDYTNLGRVIQDLPFGFQGIQNNLTQLIPSVGAFGLAFSVLTSAITFATVGFGAWNRGMGKTKQEVDELKEKLKELIKPIEDIRNEAAGGEEGEIAKVRALASVVLDQTESYQKRNRALNELKEINKGYFGDLTLEASKLELLKTKVDEYTKALVAEAVVKAFQDEIGKVAIELRKQQKELAKTVSEVNKYQKAVKEAAKLPGQALPEGGFILPELDDAEKKLKQAERIRNEQMRVVKDIASQGLDLQAAINEAIKDVLSLPPIDPPKTPGASKTKTEFLFEFLPFDPNGKLKPEQKAKLLDAADKFSSEFGNVFKGVNFRVGTVGEDQVIERAKQFWADFKKGIFQFKPEQLTLETALKLVPKDVEIDHDARVDAFIDSQRDLLGRQSKDISQGIFKPEIDRKIILADYQRAFKEIGEKLPSMIPSGTTIELIDHVTSLDTLKAGLDKLFREAQSLVNTFKGQVNNAFANFNVNAFEGIGTAIAGAISGNESLLQAAGRSIIGSIGELVSQIGRALIEYGIVKEGLDKIVIGGFAIPGAVAIAAGVAAIATGALIKNSFAKIKAFAEGGLVFGPTLGLIGEGRGTNRANPEVVAPLDKLQGFLRGSALQNQTVVVMGSLRGRDIRLQQARQQRRQRRLGGE